MFVQNPQFIFRLVSIIPFQDWAKSFQSIYFIYTFFFFIIVALIKIDIYSQFWEAWIKIAERYKRIVEEAIPIASQYPKNKSFLLKGYNITIKNY